MKINKWQCWLRGIFRSLQIGWPLNYAMSGHEFMDVEEHKNCTVTVSKCECCGKTDISWIKDNRPLP